MKQGYDSTSPSLIRLAKEQDQLAWEQLVNLYGPLVHRWCQQAGLNNEDAGDVFQETFQTVSRKLASFTPRKEEGSFRSWLKTIVRTRTIDLYRRKQKQAQAAGGTVAQTQLAEVPEPTFDESMEAAEADDALVVRRAMESIREEFDPRNWQAFLKVVFDGHSPADIARELDVDPQVIRQANYRIRRRLRNLLQDLVQNVP